MAESFERTETISEHEATKVKCPKCNIGIGLKRLANELVGNVRTVVIAGVDVVDPPRDRLASTARAALRSFGGPNTPGPASCMAPYPCGSRCGCPMRKRWRW